MVKKNNTLKSQAKKDTPVDDISNEPVEIEATDSTVIESEENKTEKIKAVLNKVTVTIKLYASALLNKLKNISFSGSKDFFKNAGQFALDKLDDIKTYPYGDKFKELSTSIKKFKFKKTGFVKFIKKAGRKLSSSWKTILTVVPMFLIFYYAVGSQIVEDMDVTTEYDVPAEKSPLFETPDSMAFLLKREVDDKMWTPNLPIIFPAYVLDNMPNFQIGIIDAVKDVSNTMRKLSFNTPAQNKDIKDAHKLLSYAPNIWIMTRKSALNLAPSSNSQYRKAAKKLKDYRRNGIFTPTAADLERLVTGIGKELQKIAQANEEYQQENSGDFWDTSSDDLFYHNRGYAFALWQITKTLSADYKDLILDMNVYPEWTYFVSSLKRAAEMKPIIIRNGAPTSVFVPNHLIMQNYYLLRALTAAEKIRNGLIREEYVRQN